MQDITTHPVLVGDKDTSGQEQIPGHDPTDRMDNSLADPTAEQVSPVFSTEDSNAKADSVRDQVLHLSYCSGGTTDTVLENLDLTLAELIDKLKKHPEDGDKDGDYVVRGPFREGCPTRSDANIAYSSLVVLDADSSLDPKTGEVTPGAPQPEFVHRILAELGINHVLHTTHSHGQPGKGNRFRVLIPAVAENSDELSGYLSWIFHRLNSRGCWLADVKENHVWSQPWYYPRLASEDSEYLFFIHDNGPVFNCQAALEWFQAESAETAALVEKATGTSPSRNPDSIYAQFNKEHGNPKWILEVLLAEGYSLAGTSQINGEISYRLLSPASDTGNAGIILFLADDGVWRVYSHHGAGEPLGRKVDAEAVSTCDAWDIFRIFEHNDVEQRAILAWEEASDQRPVIKIRDGHIDSNLTAAVKGLATQTPTAVYQRAQSLCRVAHLEETSETQGCSIPSGTAHIVSLQRPGLTVALSEAIRWEKYKKNKWSPANPCPLVTGALLEAVGMWTGIPTLVGISETPILRADGSLLARAGYDEATRLYVEGRFPEVVLPDQPSLEDAQQAAEILLAPFAEFPFVDELLDKAVLLAYLFTLALRALLPTAPLSCVSATTPGTGKGLLIEVANLLVRGRDAATMPPVQGGGGEEETRKRITALIIQGLASLNLDNWTKPIGGESMNALLTATEWSDRVLSASKIITLPNRMTIAATGNNLSVRGDMVRRSLLIQLDAGVEHPERRKFKEVDLPGRVLADRGVLLTALFTILKAYHQAGSPGCQEDLLGRFEQWSAAVCCPIRWLGFPDPLKSQESLRAQDPEAEKLELLLSAWHDRVGEGWKTAGNIIDASAETFDSIPTTATQPSTLREALVEAAPDNRGFVNGKRLGWYLRQNTGRIAGGYKLERKPRTSEASKNAQRYRVVELNAEGGDE